MPTVLRSLPNDGTLLSRRVAEDVVKDLLHITGFPEGITIVHEDDVLGSPQQLESYYTKCSKDNIRSQYGNYAFLSHTEKYPEENLNQMRFFKRVIPDLFTDQALGIRIYPHYVLAKTEITVRVRSASLTLMRDWMNKIRLAHGSMNLTWPHDILLEYLIPDEILGFLVDCYGLKEKVWPDNDTLGEYLKEHFREGVQTRSNPTGSYREIISMEVQGNVIGVMENEFVYNEVEKQPGIYEVAINYSYSYRKPLGLTVEFPATIRNQYIPKKYRDAWLPTVKADDPLRETYYFLKSLYSQDKVNNFYIGDGGSRLREWDDWFPLNYHEECQTVCIAPIRVNESDLVKVININDIPDYYCPAVIKDYLKGNYGAYGLYKESLVALEVFEVGTEEKRLAQYLDAELNLTSHTQLDPRKRYYLRISLLKDLSSYNPLLMDGLLSRPADAIKLFKFYDPDVYLSSDKTHVDSVLPQTLPAGRVSKTTPSVLYTPGGSYIERYSFSIWLKKLQWTNAKFLAFNPHGYRHASIYNIHAKRE